MKGTKMCHHRLVVDLDARDTRYESAWGMVVSGFQRAAGQAVALLDQDVHPGVRTHEVVGHRWFRGRERLDGTGHSARRWSAAGDGKHATFEVANPCGCRLVRLRMTDRNLQDMHFLNCSAFELFGALIE